MGWSPPGFSVPGMHQARRLEWAAMPFSRGSSPPKDWTQVSRVAGGFFTTSATWERSSNWNCCKRPLDSKEREFQTLPLVLLFLLLLLMLHLLDFFPFSSFFSSFFLSPTSSSSSSSLSSSSASSKSYPRALGSLGREDRLTTNWLESLSTLSFPPSSLEEALVKWMQGSSQAVSGNTAGKDHLSRGLIMTCSGSSERHYGWVKDANHSRGP